TLITSVITATTAAIAQASRPMAVNNAKMAVASTMPIIAILARIKPVEVDAAVASRWAAGDRAPACAVSPLRGGFWWVSDICGLFLGRRSANARCEECRTAKGWTRRSGGLPLRRVTHADVLRCYFEMAFSISAVICFQRLAGSALPEMISA